MTKKPKEPAAGDGGAPGCLSGRLDAWLDRRICWAIQYCAEVDGLIWRLNRALQTGRLKGWERSFAMGVLDQAKCRRWSPSNKQLATMRRLIAGLAAETDIDETDSDCAFERVTAETASVTDVLPAADDRAYIPVMPPWWRDDT